MKNKDRQLEAGEESGTAEFSKLYETMRVKESLLRQAQTMNRMGSFIWDEVKNRPEYISKEFADLFNVTLDQAYELFADREKVESLVHPDDRDYYSKALEKAKDQKQSYDVVFRSVDTNGKLHYWREMGEPIVDHDDKLSRTLGTMQNITKLKLQEVDQAERELMKFHAYEAAQIGFWTSDSEDSFRASPEMARVLGVPYKEIEHMTDVEYSERFIHKDDRQKVLDCVNSETTDPQNYKFDYRIVRGDGEIRWIRETGNWVEDTETGSWIEVGTVQDITAQKQIEHRLQASERRFRGLIENLPSGIILENEEEITLANSRMQHWCRSARADLVGKSVREVFPANIAQKFTAASAVVRESKLPHRYEFDWTIDNIVRHFIAIQFPIPVSDEAIVIGAIISDISEHRRTEQQLRQSQKMEALGQLTGGVAHDFNNLLAVIMGSAELLEKRVDGEDRKVQKLLKSIMHSSTRGAELTQRLLSFSRQLPMHPDEVDLHELLTGMKDMVTRTLGERYDVRFSSNPDTWRVVVDASQLENAILNLAINAGHAMPKGGQLYIESHNATIDEQTAIRRDEVTPGEYAVVTISDTGTGMTPEVLAKAIDPFFTTKEVGEGSGLGLSMVYGFAKQLGGDMTIYSELGHGTTVRIYLPRAKPEAEQASENLVEEQAQPGHETILVLEDNKDVRDMIEIMLEDLGYNVLLAEHAQAAHDVLESGAHFDLLLSDIILPGGISGPEFVKQIKSDYAGLKVLFMSGYAESMKYHHNGDQQEYDLISKPFRKQEIADRLRSIFDD